MSRCCDRDPYLVDSNGCFNCEDPPKVKGRFGLAWVSESPDCPCPEPVGWQVEFHDTPSKVEQKCQEMVRWINCPPLPRCDPCPPVELCCPPPPCAKKKCSCKSPPPVCTCCKQSRPKKAKCCCCGWQAQSQLSQLQSHMQRRCCGTSSPSCNPCRTRSPKRY